MFCRAPPPHLPPSLWVRYLPAWGSARDVSERPACSRVPVSPHGPAVAVRGQAGFVPVLLGPRVSADFNVLPLWPLLVRCTRQPQGSSRRLCGPVRSQPQGANVGRTLGSTLSLSLESWKSPQKSHFTLPPPPAPAGSRARFANDIVPDVSQGSVNFTFVKVLAYF